MPDLSELAQGNIKVSDTKELDIADLLGRDMVAPNQALLSKAVAGRAVMVTGAGGSIGSELCRQLLLQKPSSLIIVDQSEFSLYTIHAELVKMTVSLALGPIPVIPFLGSVKDGDRMKSIMARTIPQSVYHAAAYKHVPLVEHNPVEGIRNNAFGTMITARAALESGVENFVLISTDKAVRPTNVMGASKRLAELILQAMADDVSKSGKGTNFAMVRFGNVLGSSGSVVPLFRQQIREGGPITITHPDITRYFMTIPEASQLVIQAGAMAEGGDVFLLDMGEPVRIIDLARRMVELSGLKIRDASRPDGDIELVVTGLRPGEKLYEELLIGDNPQKTEHPLIMKAREDIIPMTELSEWLEKLDDAMIRRDLAEMRDILLRLVSGYTPTGEA
jgi:FlaA1/EpsC-like NDP-sugar epimerase